MAVSPEVRQQFRDHAPIRLILTDIVIGDKSSATEVSGKVVKIFRGYEFVRLGDRVNFTVFVNMGKERLIGGRSYGYSGLLQIQRIDGYFEGTSPNLKEIEIFSLTESEYEELMNSEKSLPARLKELWANLWK